MKTMQTAVWGALAALVVAVTAQTGDNLPECGKRCIDNMHKKATELGCADGDAVCLCKNANFAYGIRDCSTDVCGAEAAVPVIAYAVTYCNSAGAGGSGSGSPSGSGSNSMPGMSHTGSSDSIPATASATMSLGTGLPSAVTTSAIVTTITSGSEVITSTIGSTTVYHSSHATSMSSLVSSLSSAIESSMSMSSMTGTASHTSSSTTPSSTSSDNAARQTTYAGLAAAAGLAALFL
ncbi:putative effector protein [Blumeria hordei DH14]|uniref:Effector protein EC4 n=2 Tax=Blumeria hordei TaxID=2867405 RepID=G9BES0_BLUHO|nr:effector protein EC4 [Blumeria hordei]CCU74460.1 putative effector protein [Blumeria hordei DH14]